MIQISIDSPEIKLTDGIKSAVDKVGAKVEKYQDGMSLDCVIRKEAKEEIHILLRFKPRHGPEIQAEASHFDFYHGLGIAQKRIVRQVVDLKKKRESEKKHPQEDIKAMSLLVEAENEVAEGDIEVA